MSFLGVLVPYSRSNPNVLDIDVNGRQPLLFYIMHMQRNRKSEEIPQRGSIEREEQRSYQGSIKPKGPNQLPNQDLCCLRPNLHNCTERKHNH